VRKVLAPWREDTVLLARRSSEITRANRWLILGIFLGLVILLPCIMSRDQAVLTAILRDTEHVRTLAWHLSHWGDVWKFNIGLVVILACLARFRQSRFIRRLAIILFLSSALSGLTATTIRGLAGRARPDNGLTPGFYGPTLDKRKQSFPSGHTATAFGASVPLAVAFPPAGVPLLLVSGGVAWSRMQKNCHYPSDVLASIALAAFYGIPLGLAARRMRREQTNQ
jgi:membrane-associated phospholipid phosphatase